MGLMSHTIYSKIFAKKKEGINLNPFAKIAKFFIMVADFFCWLGTVVLWMGATIAALMYYVAAFFQGCFIFYAFDCIIGLIWLIGYLIFATIKYPKIYINICKDIKKWRIKTDKMIHSYLQSHLFKYSDETVDKCYKMRFKPFPKWPF